VPCVSCMNVYGLFLAYLVCMYIYLCVYVNSRIHCAGGRVPCFSFMYVYICVCTCECMYSLRRRACALLILPVCIYMFVYMCIYMRVYM